LEAWNPEAPEKQVIAAMSSNDAEDPGMSRVLE
jgi:hypothetical protein